RHGRPRARLRAGRHARLGQPRRRGRLGALRRRRGRIGGGGSLMRHPTYKHLEARLRLGAFALGQWAQISAAGVLAALFGVYLSPFPASVTIFVAIVVAGLPVAVSYGAMGLEFSVG